MLGTISRNKATKKDFMVFQFFGYFNSLVWVQNSFQIANMVIRTRYLDFLNFVHSLFTSSYHDTSTYFLPESRLVFMMPTIQIWVILPVTQK
jgi:hypothetical protein